MRLADGSFRYWYASRKQPPFRESVLRDQHGTLGRSSRRPGERASMTTIPVVRLRLLLWRPKIPLPVQLKNISGGARRPKRRAIEAVGREIKALEAVRDPTSEQQKQLQAARPNVAVAEKPAPLAQFTSTATGER